jgi:hypothetical protein
MLASSKRLPSPALILAFVALVAALGTGSAFALKGKNTVDAGDIKKNAVGSSEAKNQALTGTDVRNNSLTGADIDESTLSVSGGGGTGGGGATSNVQSFNARLAANETKTLTIGNFTVTSATNAAGTCGAIQLQAGNLDSQRSIGLNAAFANLAANATANITAANVSQAFTEVSDGGTSRCDRNRRQSAAGQHLPAHRLRIGQLIPGARRVGRGATLLALSNERL